jgi:hypothetical protein
MEPVNTLVSNIQKCSGIGKNGNTFVINVNINVDKSINTSITNTKATKLQKKTLKSFYKFIYDTKPTWYKENTYVDIDVITTAFQEYFNDYDTHVSVISKNLNGNLFTKSIRSGGVTKKKLNFYETLSKLF